MELALGHIENVDNWLYSSDGFGTAEKMAEWDKKADRATSPDFANLSDAEKNATLEAIGIRIRLRQLMYQEAFQAGNLRPRR